MLASVYPYDYGGDDMPSEKIFRNYAGTDTLYGISNNPDGFFQYRVVYGELADAARNLMMAERRLLRLIPANLDSVMWIEKSVSKAIGFHERRAVIPLNDRDFFQRSLTQYINAFRDVLRQDRWLARIDRPEVQHEDSIKLDVGTVVRDLEFFKERFRQRNQIVIDTAQFDLTNLTAFELFVVLEHIRQHRYEIEAEYVKILRRSRKQWIDTVEHKWKR